MFGGYGRFFHGRLHECEPSVAFLGVDGKREVAGAKSGVSALLDIGLSAAEAVDEKVGETFLCAAPIVLGVERTDEVICADLLVEEADHATKRVFSDGWCDEGERIHVAKG